MTRTQIQFPDPLYRRIKQIASMNDWSLADVVRRATEQYVERFPDPQPGAETWEFPVLDMGGDFLQDPTQVHSEVDAITLRAK